MFNRSNYLILSPIIRTLLSMVTPLGWNMVDRGSDWDVMLQVFSPATLISHEVRYEPPAPRPPHTMFTSTPWLLLYLVHPWPQRAVFRSPRSSTQPLISYLCTVDTVQHPPVSKNQSPSSIRHGWSWSTKPDLKIVITLLSSKSLAFKVCTHDNFAGLCFILTLIFASVWTSQQIHHHQWGAQ